LLKLLSKSSFTIIYGVKFFLLILYLIVKIYLIDIADGLINNNQVDIFTKVLDALIRLKEE